MIITPWNYPFQLSLTPLIGAIAAGNAVIIKPSELAPATSSVLKELIDSVFPQNMASVIEGDADIAKYLLDKKWDYIFFTGSTRIGKIIAEKAAKNLTPITLELGGKSPCIVDLGVDINKVAKESFLESLLIVVKHVLLQITLLSTNMLNLTLFQLLKRIL